jgi:ATP-dependent phosphofructokinase / diphosphate-dependent phosphofructokinase
MAGGNLLLIQAGGPTQVINESLYAAVDETRRQSVASRIFGAKRGLEGLVHGELADLSLLTQTQLEQIRNSPGAVLRSSRVKPSEMEMSEILKHLREHEIRQALLIGGNGTMQAARSLSQYCRRERYELQVIGIPKTVDNDINGTDRCPGYASAAHFIAQSTRDLGMDVRSLSQPVSILETMGRDVGWLAAATVMAKKSKQDAPHLVYIPEIAFELDRFLADLEEILRRQDWAIVVVSEGIRDGGGRPVYENTERSQRDDFDRPLPGGVGRCLAEIVTRRLKVRCRDEKPGLLGRASMLHVTPRDKADAELVGRSACRALAAGETEKMVALTPLRGNGAAETTLLPLENISGHARKVPKEWIGDGNPPTNGLFSDYLRPLIGNLQEYENVFDYA